ncbi:protein fantom-like, partial [Copidosoma floridanum]|uniref:protein fantom-like n=1 Tax=Copidosoma floridanum TaxID=29053 RepID=UPI0006C95064
IDPRERLVVSKLERSDLEDRYLRLLEQAQALKKLSNSQEDKIKRLATKLMRFGASPAGRPSSCGARFDVCDGRDRLSLLEAENSKLRSKVCLLRNQLMNQKIFAGSPSSRQARRASLPLASTSGPAYRTCRSDTSRLKAVAPAPPGTGPVSSCRCGSARAASTIADENDLQNYSLKIQDMEVEKRELLTRIAELELELAGLTSGNRRERVAENVEHIRLWRQMKRQGEKLAAALAANEVLGKQVSQLKRNLDDSSKSRDRVSAALAAERSQLAERDASTTRLEESELHLRERDDRIADLVKEVGILQQHNRELLELSSKFAKVERENADLKRKVAEQLADHQALRDVLSHEKAGADALQAANDQLLVKLHDLQKNIDLMTIQLMAQNEKCNRAAMSRKPGKRASNESIEEPAPDPTKKSAPSGDRAEAPKPTRLGGEEKGIQTSDTARQSKSTESQTDRPIMPISATKLSDEGRSANTDDVENNNIRKGNGRSSLSREGMLKLLEQVQISTPLESQNATIMRHGASLTFTIPNRQTSKASTLETFLFGDASF